MCLHSVPPTKDLPFRLLLRHFSFSCFLSYLSMILRQIIHHPSSYWSSSFLPRTILWYTNQGNRFPAPICRCSCHTTSHQIRFWSVLLLEFRTPWNEAQISMRHKASTSTAYCWYKTPRKTSMKLSIIGIIPSIWTLFDLQSIEYDIRTNALLQVKILTIEKLERQVEAAINTESYQRDRTRTCWSHLWHYVASDNAEVYVQRPRSPSRGASESGFCAQCSSHHNLQAVEEVPSNLGQFQKKSWMRICWSTRSLSGRKSMIQGACGLKRYVKCPWKGLSLLILQL